MMMQDKLISLIVPFYNAENTLSDCIESILNQTYRNFELILLDDGSKDNSSLICQKYVRKDSRIKYYCQKNGGVASARNFGIDIASGEYVAFVDADDYLSTEILEAACNFLLKEDIDLIVWNFYYVIGKTIQKNIPIYMNKCSRDELLCASISIGSYKPNYNLQWIMRSVWGKIFNLDIIKKRNIRFKKELYIGEDALFMFEYLLYAESIKVIGDYGYYYRHSSSSACGRYKEDLYEQSCVQMKEFEHLSCNILNSRLRNYALAVLSWRLFNDLTINESKKGKTGFIEAKKWAQLNKQRLKKIYLNRYIPRAQKIQMLFWWLPISIQCKMILLHHNRKENGA